MTFNPDQNKLLGWHDTQQNRSLGEKFDVIDGIMHNWYKEDAYGAAWVSFTPATDLPDTPINGRGICIRHNTTNSETRMYSYAGGTWKYVLMT